MFNVRRERLINIINNLNCKTHPNLFGISITDYLVKFICQVDDISSTIHTSDILSSTETFKCWYFIKDSDASDWNIVDVILQFLHISNSPVVHFVLESDFLKINIANSKLILNKYIERENNFCDLIYHEPPEWNKKTAFEVNTPQFFNMLKMCRCISDVIKIELDINIMYVSSKNNDIHFKTHMEINYSGSDVMYINSFILYDFIEMSLNNNKTDNIYINFYNGLFFAKYNNYDIYISPLILPKL